MATPKNSEFPAQVAQLAAGVTKNVAAATLLTINGETLTVAQVMARLAAIGARSTGADDAKNAWKSAVAAQREGQPAADEFVSQLIASLKVNFGKNYSVLYSFGIVPPKVRAPRTALEKAISTALAANTRAVRGTMSAKQRLAITATGKPGLTVVGPDGKALLKVAPVAPGSSEPQKVTVGPAAVGPDTKSG